MNLIPLNPTEPDFHSTRTDVLTNTGLDFQQASKQAHMENLIANYWPEKWGDEMQVLMYGDFNAPTQDIAFPDLGISIQAGNVRDTTPNLVLSAGFTVVTLRITVAAKSIEGVIDAIRRINVLCGALTLVHWGNGPFQWWSYITHASGGAVIFDFDKHVSETANLSKAIVALPPIVRQKVDAALYWIREPQCTMTEHHRHNPLRKFSAYWNAFECLIDAICLMRPMLKASPTEKQRLIDAYSASQGGKWTSEDIAHCYRTIVNPGFVGKASHALRQCFGTDADHYINECFTRKPRHERLYDIRNAIDHGDVDAENPHERFRVETRLHRLWMIVWGIFGRIVPFPCPIDPDLKKTPEVQSPQ